MERDAAREAGEQARLAAGVGVAAERIDRLARALSGHSGG